MKKQSKGFVQGFLVAILIIAFALPSFAGWQKQATLNYNGIGVILDGKNVKLKDENGNTVEPFIIDGTTYLPVRAIANALDLGVSWNSMAQAVEFTSANYPDTSPEISQDLEGKLIFDEHRIKIYYLGISATDNYRGGYEVNLRIENSSSNNIVVLARHLFVNGLEVDGILTGFAAAGKTVSDAILLSESALRAQDITSINKVTFQFYIEDTDSRVGIRNSTIITIQ